MNQLRKVGAWSRTPTYEPHYRVSPRQYRCVLKGMHGTVYGPGRMVLPPGPVRQNLFQVRGREGSEAAWCITLGGCEIFRGWTTHSLECLCHLESGKLGLCITWLGHRSPAKLCDSAFSCCFNIWTDAGRCVLMLTLLYGQWQRVCHEVTPEWIHEDRSTSFP